eukprot:Opistho-2@59787
MASFNSLPPEIVVDRIVPFLGCADVAVLAQVNRTLRAHLWRVRVVHLRSPFLEKYLDSRAFRAKFASFLPVDRLYLKTQGSPEPLTDLAAFAGVHTADLVSGPVIGTTDLSPLCGVHSVTLWFNLDITPIIDLTPLSQAHSLSIGGVSDRVAILPIANVPRIHFMTFECVDLSPLQNHRPLSVSIDNGNGHLADVSALSCAKEVFIAVCKDIVDYSPLSLIRSVTLGPHDATTLPHALGSVHTLILEEWRYLRDVSVVRSVHTLIAASSCLADVSSLRGVHTLQCRINNIDISPLQSAHALYLDGINVRGLSSLGHVHTLEFQGDPVDKADFLALGGVRHLSIVQSDQLAYVSHLRDVQKLSIYHCHRVADVSSLGGLYWLRIWSRALRDVSSLGRVHTLDLSNCVSISDVSALTSVHTLSLEGCTHVQDVSCLGGVYNLNLNRTSVSDVSALGRVRILSLAECPIEDVSSLGAVHELNISYCRQVRDCSALGRVHTLNLSGTAVVDVSALGGVHTLDISFSLAVDVSALGRVRLKKNWGGRC